LKHHRLLRLYLSLLLRSSLVAFFLADQTRLNAGEISRGKGSPFHAKCATWPPPPLRPRLPSSLLPSPSTRWVILGCSSRLGHGRWRRRRPGWGLPGVRIHREEDDRGGSRGVGSALDLAGAAASSSLPLLARHSSPPASYVPNEVRSLLQPAS
jgi:hypothetical protein